MLVYVVPLFVDRAFWGLGKFLVGGVGHVSSELNQNRLHCVVSGPIGKAGKLGGVDSAISWVDTRQVDFCNELDDGWLVRILITAVHLETVDSIFVDTVWGA